MECFQTAQCISSHSFYFLVAGNTAVRLCHVLLHVSSATLFKFLCCHLIFLLIFHICNNGYFHFSTNKLGFTPEFLGRVKLVTSIASLVGVGLYNGFLKNVPLQKIFLATTISGTALGMTQVCVLIYFCLKLFNIICILYLDRTSTRLNSSHRP